jgi:guanine deaminase
MKKLLILHGDIASPEGPKRISFFEGGFLVAENGRVRGVYPRLPDEFSGARITELADSLIMPAFCDLHLHAPQYPMLGLGLDLTLMEWLQKHTFPTEARFRDKEYARRVYSALAKELISLGTTRVCAFSSVHADSTLVLMEELERAGVSGLVGKVNMDRGCPKTIRETASGSLESTREWLEKCAAFKSVRPILTPRFVPSCTDELLSGLGALAKEKGLRVQTHLSESPGEIETVKSLSSDYRGYFYEYEKHGLTDGAILAHCVYSDAEERAKIRKHGAFAVHCPLSNIDVPTGVMPARRFLNEGVSLALGSDIAGGGSLFMPQVTVGAIRASKRNHLSEPAERPLTPEEAFWLATGAGAIALGEKPCFKAGAPLHAIAVSEERFAIAGEKPSLKATFERALYMMRPSDIKRVYANGKKVK